MFKYAPGYLTPDGQKVPMFKGWREQASSDPAQHQQWKEQFRERLTHWVLPTGEINDLLVLDFDLKYNALENFKQLGFQIPVTLYQRTLNGGYHFFFRYPKDGKKYGNRAQLRFGKLDKSKPSGIDTRGEGGYVFFYGHECDFNTPIAEAPNWLLEEYTLKHDNTNGSVATNVRLAPELAREKFLAAIELIKTALPGESNNTLNTQSYVVGQLVACDAVPYEYAYEQLFQAGVERKGESNSYEVQETIKSGLQGGMRNPIRVNLPDVPPPLAFEVPQPEASGRWTPRYFTMSDLTNRSKLKQPQLFEHWSTQDIMITTADGGTGKTTLKLYEAVCMALGERFLGFQCLKPGGKTLFITGEDSAEKLGAMLGIILEQMGLFKPEPGNAEKVDRVLKSILVKSEDEMCLVDKHPGGFFIPNENALKRVQEAVEDFKPDLIVFDPISLFWGPESALNDMTKGVVKFFSQLKKQGIAIEAINHMGKSSSQGKDDSQFAGRGGTGLPSHSRVSRALHGLTAEEYRELTNKDLDDDASVIRCTVNKFSDGSPIYNKPFLIIRRGYLFTREELSPQKQLEELNRKTDAERVFTFVKNTRSEGKYPTVKYVVAMFKANQEKLSESRVKEALQVLSIDGHMGEKVIQTQHPDGTMTEKVLIVTNMDGKEA